MSMQGLEPLFKEFIIRKNLSHFPAKGVVVDLGCDIEQTLIKKAIHRFDRIIGLDIVIKNSKKRNVELIKADLTKRLPLKPKIADAVTMLAVLEHLPGPEKIVKEAYRILKPGGVFLVTVPSPQAEKILPTLATFGIVRREMIDQHENYFTPAHLKKICKAAGFKKIHIETWELGFNTFLKATK
jgi:SAM-dependent methyltransferase